MRPSRRHPLSPAHDRYVPLRLQGGMGRRVSRAAGATGGGQRGRPPARRRSRALQPGQGGGWRLMPKRDSKPDAASGAMLDDLRDRLVEAALSHVPFDGWSQRALDAAAADLGLGHLDVLRALPGGPMQAIEHYIAMADRAMLDALEGHDLEALRPPERVALAVRVKLDGRRRRRQDI